MPFASLCHTILRGVFISVARIGTQLIDIQALYGRTWLRRRQLCSTFFAGFPPGNVIIAAGRTWNRLFLGRLAPPAIWITGPTHSVPSHKRPYIFSSTAATATVMVSRLSHKQVGSV